MLGNLQNLKQTITTIKSMSNPQAFVQNMINQNPQVKQILDQNGGDAKTAFYKLAEQKGIDPNQIIDLFK